LSVRLPYILGGKHLTLSEKSSNFAKSLTTGEPSAKAGARD